MNSKICFIYIEKHNILVIIENKRNLSKKLLLDLNTLKYALKYALKAHKSNDQNKHTFIIQFEIFCLYIEILLD